MSDESLAHYGVPGMRWGKRKGATTTSSSKSKKTRLSDMSDDELRRTNKRAQLEQEYIRRNPNVRTRGRNAAKALLGAATTAITVYNMTQSPAGQKAIELGKKAANNALNTAVGNLAVNFDGMRL